MTLSTIPTPFGDILRELASRGRLPRAEVEGILKVKSPNTASKTMREMGEMGVVQYVASGQGVESYLEFAPDWAWCGSPDFRAILSGTPNLSKIGGCV